MSECDAFKLIEEFIKKSSDCPNTTVTSCNFDIHPTLLSIRSDTYSTSSSFITSYLELKKDTTILETPPETPEPSKVVNLPVEETPNSNRPNRPYSYYVATNFHPLDLSIITPSTTDNDDSKLEQTITEKPVKRRTIKKRDEVKRLSMSLTDIKLGKMEKIENSKKTLSFFKLNSKKSKSNQNNLDKDFEEVDDDTFTKSTNSFKRSIFNSTMPARINSKNKNNNNNNSNSPNTTQSGKINRFFRNLFGLEKPTQKDVDLDSSQSNFKFSRLFSFRQQNSRNSTIKPRESISTAERSYSTSTNDTQCPLQLVVTDEQPSKIILPQISLKNEIVPEQYSPDSSGISDLTESFNKMSSLDNLESLKEKFYSEVADRLKKIASCTNSSTNFSSQEKSSLSSIDLFDIPYIDDENEQIEENLCSYSDFNFSQTSSKFIKTDMSDVVIEPMRLNEFIRDASYAKFDELAIDYLNRYDTVWNKIAILFELINRCVQIVTNSNQIDEFNQILVMKLKEIAANYIHDKYCDWIYKNGGWKSVPDIISLPRENSERLH